MWLALEDFKFQNMKKDYSEALVIPSDHHQIISLGRPRCIKYTTRVPPPLSKHSNRGWPT